METFAYCRYITSTRACVIPNPLLPCHALQLNLTRTHHRSTTPVLERHTFDIPPSCLRSPLTAFSFVGDLFLSLGMVISWSVAQSLTSCIVGLDSGMGAGDASVLVVASVFVEHNDVVIGDDDVMMMMMPHLALSNDDDDDTIIHDAYAFGSTSADASKELLLKEILFDRATNGDGLACPICLDMFEDGCSAIITQCSHLFHGECIDKWIEKKTSNANCPLCRSQLFA